MASAKKSWEKPIRRAVLLSCLGAALAASLAPGFAQTPMQASKPIRVIVPFPPGGVSDALGRMISDKVTALLGPPLIVENRGGASGNIGAEAVWRSEPDDHTLLMAPPHVFTVNPVLYKMSFDVSAFVPVTGTSSTFVSSRFEVPEVPSVGCARSAAMVGTAGYRRRSASAIV